MNTKRISGKTNSHALFIVNMHGSIKYGLIKNKVGEKHAEKTKTFMKPIDKSHNL